MMGKESRPGGPTPGKPGLGDMHQSDDRSERYQGNPVDPGSALPLPSQPSIPDAVALEQRLAPIALADRLLQPARRLSGCPPRGYGLMPELSALLFRYGNGWAGERDGGGHASCRDLVDR